MKNYKLLLVLGLLIFINVGAQSDCDKSKISNKKQPNKMENSNKKMPDESVSKPQNSNIKTLAEGSNGKIEKPFIFVARTKETYAQLQTMAENLPSASEIDFNKSAVVAAFAGTKNTGGFSVAFDKTGEEISVKLLSPPEGAMVTEALTMPYKIELIPVEREKSLTLNLSENWKSAAQTYKVTSGEFTVSGGFVARESKFEPQGTIEVLTSGEFVTFNFNLIGKGNDKKLDEIVSGTLRSGKANLEQLQAENFIDRPHLPLKISPTFSGSKLLIEFEPGNRDYALSDGFEGRGKLEAEKVDLNMNK